MRHGNQQERARTLRGNKGQMARASVAQDYRSGTQSSFSATGFVGNDHHATSDDIAAWRAQRQSKSTTTK